MLPLREDLVSVEIDSIRKLDSHQQEHLGFFDLNKTYEQLYTLIGR